jgi:hypothetical protein
MATTTWNLTGNAHTKPAIDFLGTTDNKPLSIQPGSGDVGIGTRTPSGKLEVNRNWDGNFGALTISGTIMRVTRNDQWGWKRHLSGKLFARPAAGQFATASSLIPHHHRR